MWAFCVWARFCGIVFCVDIGFAIISLKKRELVASLYRFILALTLEPKETPFNLFANRADPDQAALVRVYYVCLWNMS